MFGSDPSVVGSRTWIPGLKQGSTRTVVAGTPELLFDGPFVTTQDSNYDVFPDGEHFLMIEADPDAQPSRLRVVQNWFEELKRLVPVE